MKGSGRMAAFEELLALEEMKDAKVIAGAKGLDREVTWSHIIYSAEISAWLGAGHLAITNGAGFQYAERDLIHILEQLYQIKAAGIIVEKGKFINVISPKVRQKADELGLPVIEAGHKLDMAGLTRAIGELCFRNHMGKSKAQQLKELVYLTGTQNIRQQMEDLGYDMEKTYVAAAIQIDHISSRKKDNTYYCTHLEQQILSIVAINFMVAEKEILFFEERGIYCYFIPLSKEHSSQKKQYEICDKIRRDIANAEADMTVCIGISNLVTDFKGVRGGIYQAKYALQSLHLCQKQNDVRLYENVGIYRIFFQYHNDEALLKIYRRILGELERQDEETKSQLMETLETYFNCNCNLSRTSEEMFIHRNTLKYRLKKIKEILRVDFDDCNSNFTIQFAFKIKKYMTAQGMM